MIEMEIQKELATLDGGQKRLCLVSWNSRPPKLDLRAWHEKDGKQQPGKGLTLTDAEAADLVEALQEYLKARA